MNGRMRILAIYSIKTSTARSCKCSFRAVPLSSTRARGLARRGLLIGNKFGQCHAKALVRCGARFWRAAPDPSRGPHCLWRFVHTRVGAMEMVIGQIHTLSTRNDSDLKKLKDFLRHEQEFGELSMWVASHHLVWTLL